jgi:filamin
VDKPAVFSVNLNGVNGTLKGYVTTPSGNQEDMIIQEIDNELNSCRFLPKENGVYYVNLKFEDAHIPGSPFPMLIGKLGADPALVQAKGDGLEKGEVGMLNLDPSVV